jgi:hypothetical protein
MFEYRLLRLTDDDELIQVRIDELAKDGWALQEVVPPAHHAGSSHHLYPALVFSREAPGAPPVR